MGLQIATRADRPGYEKEEDRETQRNVIAYAGSVLGWNCREMPLKHFYDYERLGGRNITDLIEVKRRFVEAGRYPDVYLSKEKADRMLFLSRKLRVPPQFLVWFDDEVRMAVLDSRFRVIRAGRRDRGDPFDIEDVYLVPRSSFKMLFPSGVSWFPVEY